MTETVYQIRSRHADHQRYADELMEEEILETLLTAKHLRVGLAQIARTYGIPLDVVETIANKLSIKHLKVDVERLEFEAVIKQIAHLEQTERDPGAREWKLQALGRRYRRTTRQLMDVYNKSICQSIQPKVVNIADFRAQHDQEVEWLIQGWLPKGSTLLFHAEGGVGKTLFCYEILEAVAQGKNWNGYATSQGSVLLVQSDEPSLVTAERMNIRGIRDTDPVHILPGWQVEYMQLLQETIETLKPSLVIVDSLTAINRNCVFSENDTEYARPLLQLAELANQNGCTIIIIHHSNAEGNSRGTRATFNSVSEVWGLSSVDLKERLLRVQKTRLGRPPGRYKFLFDDEDYSFHYLGEENNDGEDGLTQEERIRLWLSEEPQRGICYAPVEISEALGIGREATRRGVRELWAKGLIRRTKRRGSGYYTYYVAKTTSKSLEPNLDIHPMPQAIENETPIACRSDLNSFQGKGFKLQAIAAGHSKNNKSCAIVANLRSVDRLPAETEVSHGTKDNSISDRSSDRKRSQTNKPVLIENVCNTPLQNGTECEVLVGGRWTPGKYIGDRGMKLYKPTRSLEPCYRVKTRAGNIDVFAHDFRVKEGECE